MLAVPATLADHFSAGRPGLRRRSRSHEGSKRCGYSAKTEGSDGNHSGWLTWEEEIGTQVWPRELCRRMRMRFEGMSYSGGADELEGVVGVDPTNAFVLRR